jgi:hypothetical protein
MAAVTVTNDTVKYDWDSSLDSTTFQAFLDEYEEEEEEPKLGIKGLEKHAPFFVSLAPGSDTKRCLRAAGKIAGLFVWPVTLDPAPGADTKSLNLGTLDHFAVESLGSLTLISRMEMSRIFSISIGLNTVQTFDLDPEHPFSLLTDDPPTGSSNCRMVPIVGICKDANLCPNPGWKWNCMIRGREGWLSDMSDCDYKQRYGVVGLALHVFRGSTKAGTIMRLGKI